MSRPSSKEAILDAAEAVVIESGASHMTLDAVAERSGISKGGLIYHFPTKESLLEGMIDRLSEQFEHLREKAREELHQDTPSELMVEIRMLQGKASQNPRLSAALLAVTANQPELISAMRQNMRERFFDVLVPEEDFLASSILFFAAVGLHFHDLLSLSLLDQKQKTRVYEELLRLAGERPRSDSRPSEPKA
ncbi:TetR family transcriptional regulator [bacterium]|nr:TetR family transcriptional regulator [bacterium]